MQKIGDVTNTADGNGEYTNGNVAAGVAPTILDAVWFNTIQREIINVISKAGIKLNKNNDAQLSEAIFQLISNGKIVLTDNLGNSSGLAVSQKLTNQVNDNANTRLEKSKNGADIPDPKRFVENLGLDKTVRFKQSVIVGSDEKFLRLRADDGGAHADSAVDMFLWGDTSRGGERKTILEAKDKLGPLWWAHRLISDAVHFGVPGQIVPTNYDNFDSRYGGINTALKLTNGWWKCGDSGFIIQSGRISVGDNEVVTAKFPIPFPDECTSLVVTARSQVENADSDVLSAYGIAISQSHMRVSISTNFSGPVSGISFIAMGY